MVLLDDFLERPAVDELHDVERLALLVDAQLVDRHDARVFELAGDLGLDAEAVDLVRPLAQHPFQRHRPADRGVLGQPDFAHAALGVGSLQEVAAAAGRGGGSTLLESRPRVHGGLTGWPTRMPPWPRSWSV